METAIQVRATAVKPRHSERSNRKSVLPGLVANVYAAIAACDELERTGCPQWVRLDEAKERLQQAKSLILQITILETENG